MKKWKWSQLFEKKSSSSIRLSAPSCKPRYATSERLAYYLPPCCSAFPSVNQILRSYDMQLRCSYNGVNSLSKQCCDLLDTRRSLTGRRGLVVKAWPKGREGVGNVAILGGGITGLATAFFLVEANPACNITIFEASSRLGGWLHSKQVDIGNGNIVFEQGPRNLRPSQPNGLLTLHMVSIYRPWLQEHANLIHRCISWIC